MNFFGFNGREGVQNRVEHGGMLEILARYAWMESRYILAGAASVLK